VRICEVKTVSYFLPNSSKECGFWCNSTGYRRTVETLSGLQIQEVEKRRIVADENVVTYSARKTSIAWWLGP
jgi:hypothetical protein